MTTEFQVVSVSPQIIKKKARVFGKGGIRCHICHRSQGSRIRGIAEWPPVPWIQQYQFCESPRVEHPPDPSRDRLGAAGRPGGLAFSGSERQILGRPGQWCWIGRSAPHCGVVLLVFEASVQAALAALILSIFQTFVRVVRPPAGIYPWSLYHGSLDIIVRKTRRANYHSELWIPRSGWQEPSTGQRSVTDYAVLQL